MRSSGNPKGENKSCRKKLEGFKSAERAELRQIPPTHSGSKECFEIGGIW
jgi:hypothetical protein